MAITEKEVKESVEWIAENLRLVTNKENNKIDWKKAKSDPPSDFTRGMLEWAARNQTTFWKDMVFKNVEDASDALNSEEVEVEKKAVNQIRSILKKYVDSIKK